MLGLPAEHGDVRSPAQSKRNRNRSIGRPSKGELPVLPVGSHHKRAVRSTVPGNALHGARPSYPGEQMLFARRRGSEKAFQSYSAQCRPLEYGHAAAMPNAKSFLIMYEAQSFGCPAGPGYAARWMRGATRGRRTAPLRAACLRIAEAVRVLRASRRRVHRGVPVPCRVSFAGSFHLDTYTRGRRPLARNLGQRMATGHSST